MAAEGIDTFKGLTASKQLRPEYNCESFGETIDDNSETNTFYETFITNIPSVLESVFFRGIASRHGRGGPFEHGPAQGCYI